MTSDNVSFVSKGLCCLCRGHGIEADQRTHSCPYNNCQCYKCNVIRTRRAIIAQQLRLRRLHNKKEREENEEKNGRSRSYLCLRCRYHGELVPKKDHKQQCPYASCQCSKCQLCRNRSSLDARIRLRKADEQNSGLEIAVNIAGSSQSPPILQQIIKSSPTPPLSIQSDSIENIPFIDLDILKFLPEGYLNSLLTTFEPSKSIQIANPSPAQCTSQQSIQTESSLTITEPTISSIPIPLINPFSVPVVNSSPVINPQQVSPIFYLLPDGTTTLNQTISFGLPQTYNMPTMLPTNNLPMPQIPQNFMFIL